MLRSNRATSWTSILSRSVGVLLLASVTEEKKLERNPQWLNATGYLDDVFVLGWWRAQCLKKHVNRTSRRTGKT